MCPIPTGMLVFNDISVSLPWVISDFEWDECLLMRPDGLSLLPDLLIPEGRTIVSPKDDQFVAEDPLIAQTSAALLLTILERIGY